MDVCEATGVSYSIHPVAVKGKRPGMWATRERCVTIRLVSVSLISLIRAAIDVALFDAMFGSKTSLFVVTSCPHIISFS